MESLGQQRKLNPFILPASRQLSRGLATGQSGSHPIPAIRPASVSSILQAQFPPPEQTRWLHPEAAAADPPSRPRTQPPIPAPASDAADRGSWHTRPCPSAGPPESRP